MMNGLPKYLGALALAAVLLMTSCGEDSGKPASSNRPYEVLLYGDCGQLVYNELSDTVEGLPQPEPQFDVVAAHDSASAPWQQFMRSIVKVVVDRKARATTLDLKRNVYAKPQALLTLTTPSADSLRIYLQHHKGYIAKVLDTFERGVELRRLKKRHNEEAGRMVSRMFGVDMLIPDDMTSSKRGRDFLWLSNNQNEGLQNICVYRVKDDGRSFRQVRDSVMKANIPGERPGMYMTTTKSWPSGPFFRGLWDVHGDIMGGPFVARKLKSSSYIIYIEGFVYAPEGKKRNKMHHLEASLISAKVR